MAARPHPRWTALAVLAALACGCFGAAATPAAGAGITEEIAPDYIVFLPPGGIFGLSPQEDRFAVEITRREKSPQLEAVHLTLAITHEGTTLTARSRTDPVTDGRHAVIREGAVVPVWETIRRGRLVGLWQAWRYDGFALDAEVRENGPEGRLIYRRHTPNLVIGISRRGFYDRYGLPLALGGTGIALLLSLAAARFAPPGRPRRTRAAFDLGALALIAACALAFSRYAMLAVWSAALLLPLIPGRVKERVFDSAAGALREARLARAGPQAVSWAPAGAVVIVTAWLLAWHVTLLLALGFEPSDFSEYLKLLAALYLAAALTLVLPLHAALGRRARGGRPLWPLIAAAVAVILAWVAARALDWGAFFFSSGHLDEDFWTHAFHGRMLTFLGERQVRVLLTAAAGSAVLLVLVLGGAVRVARRAAAPGAVLGRRPLKPLLRVNAFAAAAVVAAAGFLWPYLSAPSGRDISDSIREAFSGVPEAKVAASLAHTLLVPEPADPPPIDAALGAKLERAGLRLNALDPRYPLMKPSIYLDPVRAAEALRPRVAPGTNLIVILAESLSAGLVEEKVHGVAGLTPHIDDFRAHSYAFRNLYSSDFPTIKGQLAALASFAFDHRGLAITADAGNPLKSRFLFLSDVLSRARGYAAYHLQSDYASFAATARILGRHGYARFYSAEDGELQRRAVHPIAKTWGLYDEDLFRALAEMLAEEAFRRPFLLTVATTDMHFPYATLRRHPGTHGNALLDAVHSEDVAFGVFWEAFKRSPRAADTLVLLTADHALVRSLVRSGGADPRLSEFDYLFGALYVPGDPRWAGGGTDTVCTQLDLAPTLLDVMGVDTPNPFLGLSIFSERPRHPLALSREIPTDRWSPEDRAAAQAIGWTPGDHRQFQAWLRHLAVANRVLPPEGMPAR
jgi:hypothetical protein